MEQGGGVGQEGERGGLAREDIGQGHRQEGKVLAEVNCYCSKKCDCGMRIQNIDMLPFFLTTDVEIISFICHFHR